MFQTSQLYWHVFPQQQQPPYDKSWLITVIYHKHWVRAWQWRPTKYRQWQEIYLLLCPLICLCLPRFGHLAGLAPCLGLGPYILWSAPLLNNLIISQWVPCIIYTAKGDSANARMHQQPFESHHDFVLAVKHVAAVKMSQAESQDCSTGSKNSSAMCTILLCMLLSYKPINQDILHPKPVFKGF